MSHSCRSFSLPWILGLACAAATAGARAQDAGITQTPSESRPLPSLQVQHVHDRGRWFGLSGIRATVDGAVLAELPGRVELPSGTVLDVSAGKVQAGRRTLDITILYDGRSDHFTYLHGYRFRMRTRLSLNIRPNHEVKVRTIAHERPELARERKQRPSLVVEVIPREAVIGVEVFPVDEGPLVEGAPGTPFTRTTFAVERVLKGRLPRRIVVQVIGGQLGDTTVASPVHAFARTGRYILFLGPDGPAGPTIFPQAVLGVKQEGGTDVVEPAPAGLRLPASKPPRLDDVLVSLRR